MYDKSFTTISEILDAAQQLFVTRSYDDITMSGIAKAAGVTKGAIYHHFENKVDLYMRMMQRYLSTLQELLQQAVEASGTAKERLTLLTTLYLALPLDEQQVFQLIRRDANRFAGEERNTLVAAYQDALPNQIEVIIQDGITAKSIRASNTRLLAWQFAAIVEASLTDYAREQFHTPQAMAEYLTTVFFDGVAEREEE